MSTVTTNGLPRRGVPISLQRFEPGSLPKRQQRSYVGKTNRLQEEANLADSLQKVFIDDPDRLSVAQRLRCTGYLSAEDGTKLRTRAQQTTRSIRAGRGTARMADSTLTLDGDDAVDDKDGDDNNNLHHHHNSKDVLSRAAKAGTGKGKRGKHILPPATPPPTPPQADLAFQTALLEVDMHPAVATLLHHNAYGKGRNPGAENFFLQHGEDPVYTVPQDSKLDTYPKLPFIVSNRAVVAGCGGGELEYDDPIEDDRFARNAFVARNRILRRANAASGAAATETPKSKTVQDGRRTAASSSSATTTTTTPVPSSAPRGSRLTPKAALSSGRASHRGGSRKGSSGQPGGPGGAASTDQVQDEGGEEEESEAGGWQGEGRPFDYEEAERQYRAQYPQYSTEEEGAAAPTPTASRQGRGDSEGADVLVVEPGFGQPPPRVDGGGPAEARGSLSDNSCGCDAQQQQQCGAAENAIYARESPPLCAHASQSAPSDAAASGPCSRHSSHARFTLPLRPPRDAWVDDFTPSVDPYKFEPFRGRCGYSDVRLTFHRVQADPRSAMHPAPTEQWCSVNRVPLETPSNWQMYRVGRRRYDE